MRHQTSSKTAKNQPSIRQLSLQIGTTSPLTWMYSIFLFIKANSWLRINKTNLGSLLGSSAIVLHSKLRSSHTIRTIPRFWRCIKGILLNYSPMNVSWKLLVCSTRALFGNLLYTDIHWTSFVARSLLFIFRYKGKFQLRKWCVAHVGTYGMADYVVRDSKWEHSRLLSSGFSSQNIISFSSGVQSQRNITFGEVTSDDKPDILF